MTSALLFLSVGLLAIALAAAVWEYKKTRAILRRVRERGSTTVSLAAAPAVDWHHVDLSRLPDPEAEADRLERLHPQNLPIAICLGTFTERA